MTNQDIRLEEHDESRPETTGGRPRSFSRREFLAQGSSALAFLAVMNSPLLARFAQAEDGTDHAD